VESNANRRRNATPTHNQEKKRREFSGTTESRAKLMDNERKNPTRAKD
jgi:hypothetical protein